MQNSHFDVRNGMSLHVKEIVTFLTRCSLETSVVFELDVVQYPSSTVEETISFSWKEFMRQPRRKYVSNNGTELIWVR